MMQLFHLLLWHTSHSRSIETHLSNSHLLSGRELFLVDLEHTQLRLLMLPWIFQPCYTETGKTESFLKLRLPKHKCGKGLQIPTFMVQDPWCGTSGVLKSRGATRNNKIIFHYWAVGHQNLLTVGTGWIYLAVLWKFSMKRSEKAQNLSVVKTL